MQFRDGQVIYRNAVVYSGHATAVKEGHPAVVTRADAGYLNGRRMVDVRWLGDTIQNDGRYFEDYFSGHEGSGVNVRELLDVLQKPAPSDVDNLITLHAERLRKAIDNGTVVAPYSEIGVFAAFLIDYKMLESK